jgi:hypothetical protein
MKSRLRALTGSAFFLLLLTLIAFAQNLGAGEARQQIAAALGFDNTVDIHIKDMNSGLNGRQMVVEATIDTAFRLERDNQGKWKVVEVRTGDRRWESIELIETAVRKEKVLRTTADLRTLSTALEAYRREQGSYVTADSGRNLIDALAPRYLPVVLRLDAWSNEFAYRGTPASYKLSSAGPDGKANTGDDIVIENGQLTGGAGQ